MIHKYKGFNIEKIETNSFPYWFGWGGGEDTLTAKTMKEIKEKIDKLLLKNEVVEEE